MLLALSEAKVNYIANDNGYHYHVNKIYNQNNTMPISLTNNTHWPLLFTAPLLGLSQSILLVYTPVLMELTALTLGQLALIMALGSSFFLFSTPFWANRVQHQGYKKVLYQGIYGFAFSFFLIYGLLYLQDSGDLSELGFPEIGVLCTLMLARIIYGLTAAAIVPTCQAWISHQAKEHVIIKLGKLSAAMAAGRLLGPMLALGLLCLGPRAPLAFLSIFPLLCIGLIWRVMVCPSQIRPPSQIVSNKQKSNVTSLANKWRQWRNHFSQSEHCLLLMVGLMAASYSIFCYLLTPISQQWLGLDAIGASKLISILMSLAAASMLVSHMLLSRFWLAHNGVVMLICSGLMLLGLGFMALGHQWGLYLAAPLMSTAFASIQLRSLSLLCEKFTNSHKVIATSALAQYQTCGYLLGAILLSLTDADILLNLLAIILMTLTQLGLIINGFFLKKGYSNQ
jgi:MFS family permease